LTDKYLTRRAGPGDGEKLQQLFDAVFHPENVGQLARAMFDHFPRLERRCWFIAEERASQQIVGAFVLIPWTLALEGVELKAAEMGIVGTLKEHRRQGLMRRLNAEFDQALCDEDFDLAMIQGIPGFYQRLGFRYALPLENHINVPFHVIADRAEDEEEAYTFRLAEVADIPALMREDETYRARFSVACHRDEPIWQYLLTHSRDTVYGSEFWLMEQIGGDELYYFRIPREGFGKGLIVSEVSDAIHHGAMQELLRFCKAKALECDKPYVRLNVHNESAPGGMAIHMGAEAGRPYAWQMKIPDVVRYLRHVGPVLERRLQSSACSGYTGTVRLNLYRSQVDLTWDNGSLVDVGSGEGECDDTFAVPEDLFPPLCLGHRGWRELQHLRPDIGASGQGAMLLDAFFPATVSWIHEQY